MFCSLPGRRPLRVDHSVNRYSYTATLHRSPPWLVNLRLLIGSAEHVVNNLNQLPGTVIDLRVKVGDRVSAGDTVLLLEAMKMEHPMRAREDGVVSEVRVTEGEQVEAGALLLVIEPAQES